MGGRRAPATTTIIIISIISIISSIIVFLFVVSSINIGVFVVFVLAERGFEAECGRQRRWRDKEEEEIAV